MRRETILAGDIGGTNTRLLLFELRSDDPQINLPPSNRQEAPGTLLLNVKYENINFDSFSAVVKTFLHEAELSKPPITACFAVAGPVKDNVVRVTNRQNWTIDGDVIAEDFGIAKVLIINDFLAVGYGLLTLNEQTECVTLQHGIKQANAPIACLGAGTGLGECFLTPSADGTYQCFPTEGGHSDYAPRNDIYEYLCETFPEKVDHEIHAQVEQARELKGAVISANKHNPLCKQTMDIFITAYGAEAGVAGLKWLPHGGLYLTGGLTPKNIDAMRDPDGLFMEALLDKGRMRCMLCSIPIYAVLVENMGERGAHFVAFKELQSLLKQQQQEKEKEKAASVSASASASAADSHTQQLPPQSPRRSEQTPVPVHAPATATATVAAGPSLAMIALTAAAVGTAFLLGRKFRS